MTQTVLVVHLDIVPERFDEFLQIVGEHGERSQRIEPGCLGFRVLRPADQPGKVILVETYQDEDALQSHFESEHMQAYLARTGEMIISRERHRCIE